MEDADNSFDENESVDLTSVIAEFPNGDDLPGQKIPAKKLSSVFASCIPPVADESMKVFLRIRPMKHSKDESTIIVKSETSIMTNAPESSRRAQYTKTEERHYIFSKIFGPECEQEDVYDRTAAPLLRRFFSGENCVLFAYGMTNSGKTYTMQGNNSNPGVLPRLVSAILSEIEKENATQACVEHSLHISMLEIYKDNIFDLLSKKKEKLSIRDANGKVEVNNLSSHEITCTKEALKFMDVAASKRSKSSTFLNTGSSRSHAVYTITLDKKGPIGSQNQSMAFQLVDLAGAERGNRTKASSAQQKEANQINKSLMQLWRCLQGMKKRQNSELSSSQDIIPFRESKLTHLLMPILGRAGMAGVAMVACVNPHTDDYDETISILGNASLASKIKEISDVGRTLAQHQMVAALPAAAAGASKRRRVESTATTGGHYMEPTAATRIATAANLSAHASAIASAHAHAPHHGAKKGGNHPHPNTRAIPVHGDHAAGLKRKHPGAGKESCGSYSSLATESSEGTHHLHSTIGSDGGSVHDPAVESERKRLRREVEHLREENANLVQAQLSRETEIRAEVCEEMAVRSAHLLDQIQTLQVQLAGARSGGGDGFGSGDSGGGSGSGGDHDVVTKSVKKASRKEVLRRAQDAAERDLREAEDELERLKARYEREIAVLKNENITLANTLRTMQTGGGGSTETHTRMPFNYNTGCNVAAAAGAGAGAASAKKVRIASIQNASGLNSSATLCTTFEDGESHQQSGSSSQTGSQPHSSSVGMGSSSGASKCTATFADNWNKAAALLANLEGAGVSISRSSSNEAAEEFSQRMQRDQRFKKPHAQIDSSEYAENAPVGGKLQQRGVAVAVVGKKSPLARSPNRSPLAEVSNSPGVARHNSPLKGRQLQGQGQGQGQPVVKKPVGGGGRGSTAGTARTYSTRLRSQQMRA